MARNLEVLPEAAEEAAEAVRWYYERNPRAAIAFQAEVVRAFTEIAESPEMWSPHHHGTRRILLGRFPYEVVYRVYTNVVLVVAVAHCKRKPGYWRER